MGDVRYYAETRCVHGESNSHPVWEDGDLTLDPSGFCPGGVRRELTLDALIGESLRSAVESGRIEGEVRGWCVVHDAQAWDGRDLFCLLHPGDSEERSCQMERALVIPFELEPVATGGQSQSALGVSGETGDAE